MRRFLTHCLPLAAAALALRGTPAPAQPPTADKLETSPRVAAASDEGVRAIAKFRIPEGFKVELFAAEPMLANPVAFALDERNRVYVAETFRVHAGVTDNRKHMDWLDVDLANRTTADRVAMYRKFAGDKFASYGLQPDRIRLVEDRDGDGKADHATIFADGFNKPEDGIGSGLLVRGKDVWYTCIPDLWHLRDEDGDGKADSRKSLQTGYGVHVALLGHDSHGLRMGPDGRLYFSIGDRGLNLKTADGRTLTNLESGSVLRCEPDGSNLELFATGLRNPQELVFDERGDLFTVDNNSDSGDKARCVNVVEGSDSGWRIGFQYIESPTSRGPWNAEKLWHPRHDGQAAYLFPPIANISDGPSGLTHDPGTGLPEAYRHHFFLADFRGASGNSGIRSFALKPKGASFELVDSKEFLWHILATDCDFGSDGALYVSDWVEGWETPGKGRIYKVTPATADPRVGEVKALIAEGLAHRTAAELVKLLAHPDQRVRQEAQFALAAKGKDAVETLVKVAKSDPDRLARVHAIWGLGQIGRNHSGAISVPLVALLSDVDAEVRAQAVRTLADVLAPPRLRSPFRPPLVNTRALSYHRPLIYPLLQDESPRVRMFAALGLGAMGPRMANTPFPCKDAVEPLIRLLRADGHDPILRHAAVMGLVGTDDADEILKFASDDSAPARMGVLLALRRLGRPEVARFFDDKDPTIVVEAARAINDAPVEPAMPALAAKLAPGLPEPLLRRAINANLRVGGPEAAARLADFAAAKDAPESPRVEALDVLASWTNPSNRDRILGTWRPVAAHPAEEAAAPLRRVLPGVLASAPDPVRVAAAQAAGARGVKEAGPALLALVADAGRSGEARAAAIKALDALADPRLAEAVKAAVAAKDPKVRVEGQRLLAKVDPADAVRVLESSLAAGSLAERQGALTIFGELKHPEADAILARRLDDLLGGRAPADVQLELIEAAGKRSDSKVKEKLARYESSRPSDDPVARYREALAGGDAARGRKVFTAKAEVECVRCHRVRQATGEGVGGDVGPDLTDVGRRVARDYILESIVAPNRKIAKGFETTVLALADGRTVAGIVKADDGKSIKLQPPQGPAFDVAVVDIEERKTGLSGMPEDLVKNLSKAEIRDLVEFLAGLK